MAANMKAVKLRMKSIQSTMQITKAMELVASSKLRRAKERADASRPYFHTFKGIRWLTLRQAIRTFIGLYQVRKKRPLVLCSSCRRQRSGRRLQCQPV